MKLSSSPPVLGLLAVSLLLSGRAQACNARRNGAAATVRARQLSATVWNIFIPGYRTQAVGLGVHFCAAAVRVPAAGVITSVTGISLFEEANAAPLSNFSWSASSAVAASFNRLAAGSWTGFLGQVTGPNPGGVDNMIAFQLQVKPGTTFAQLSAALQGSRIGTDGARTNGELLGNSRFLLTPATVQQDTSDLSSKLFYNTAHTSGATRQNASGANVLYFMQPGEFRQGQGTGTGWRGVLQDQNSATSEAVEFGFVDYASGGAKPNVTAAGSRTSVTYSLFGTTTGARAFLYTLTLAKPVAIARQTGIRITLPAPRSATDAAFVHTQEGTTTKIAAAKKKQWTYVLQAGAAANYRTVGTTIYMGGLYDCGTVALYSLSTAYKSPAEKLFGPESVYPDSARGDRVGFQIRSKRFAGDFGLVFLAPGYLPQPLSTPFKDILIQNLTVAGSAFVLDTAGIGDTGAVPVPAGISFAAQALMFHVQGGQIARLNFTDATLVQVQ